MMTKIRKIGKRMSSELLSIPIEPNFEAFRANILRQGTPKRVHFLELFEYVLTMLDEGRCWKIT